MRGDQRDQDPVGLAEFDDDRRHQRGDDDVVRRGGQAHAEDQADQRGEDQDQEDVAARERLHHLAHDLTEPGQRHRADDDAGRGDGAGNADHVARAADQALDQFVETDPRLRADLAGMQAPEQGLDRALGEQDQDQDRNRIEGRKDPATTARS